MARAKDVGVFQLDNGKWAYRYTFTTGGKRVSQRGSKDELGNPLKTKTEAIRARSKALELDREGKKPAHKIRKTIKDVYAAKSFFLSSKGNMTSALCSAEFGPKTIVSYVVPEQRKNPSPYRSGKITPPTHTSL